MTNDNKLWPPKLRAYEILHDLVPHVGWSTDMKLRLALVLALLAIAEELEVSD